MRTTTTLSLAVALSAAKPVSAMQAENNLQAGAWRRAEAPGDVSPSLAAFIAAAHPVGRQAITKGTPSHVMNGDADNTLRLAHRAHR